jgi:flagellar assembly factor FliW
MRKKPIIHISSDNQTFLHCNLVNPLALEDREARCFKLRVQLVEICKKFRALKLIVINPKKFSDQYILVVLSIISEDVSIKA